MTEGSHIEMSRKNVDMMSEYVYLWSSLGSCWVKLRSK